MGLRFNKSKYIFSSILLILTVVFITSTSAQEYKPYQLRIRCQQLKDKTQQLQVEGYDISELRKLNAQIKKAYETEDVAKIKRLIAEAELVLSEIKNQSSLTDALSPTLTTTNNHFGADLLWFGVLKERTNQETLDTFKRQVKELGIEAVRFDVYWGAIEKNRGSFDWSSTDKLVNTVSSDTDIVFTLYSSSKWGSKYSKCRNWLWGNLKISVEVGPPSSIPKNMKDYLSFLEKIVNRYKDKVKYWQIENEIYGARKRQGIPDFCPQGNKFWLGTKEEYLELLKASYKKIKQIDPQATVFASSYIFQQPKQFFRFILNKARNYSDLWDLHLYQGPYEDIEKITMVKNEMKRLGYSKRLWLTEVGQVDINYHKDRHPEFFKSYTEPEELKLQSEETIKRYVQAFGEGIEKVFMLRISTHKARMGPQLNFTHMGLTFDAKGLKRKPAYFTYKIMYSKIGGFDSVEKLGRGKYKFLVNGKPVLVLWNDYSRERFDTNLYLLTDNVLVTQIITEPAKTDEAEVKIIPADSVIIDKTPVFVEGVR